MLYVTGKDLVDVRHYHLMQLHMRFARSHAHKTTSLVGTHEGKQGHMLVAGVLAMKSEAEASYHFRILIGRNNESEGNVGLSLCSFFLMTFYMLLHQRID